MKNENIKKTVVETILISGILLVMVKVGFEHYLEELVNVLPWWQYLMAIGIVGIVIGIVLLGFREWEKKLQSKHQDMYLKKLIEQREIQKKEYMPLSYMPDDKKEQKPYMLEELMVLEGNKKGFALYADGGFGKTWSMIELAGQVACKALEEKKEQYRVFPVFVQMGELKNPEISIAQIIEKEVFGSDNKDEKLAKQFLEENKVILFIDAIDEAAVDVRKKIAGELKNYYAAENGPIIIVTTRESSLEYVPEKLDRFYVCSIEDDEMIKSYMDKLILDEEINQKAKRFYFEDVETSFLRGLRTPFYLKTFVEYMKGGGEKPTSAKGMIKAFVKALIVREKNKNHDFTTQFITIESFLMLLAGHLDRESSGNWNATLRSIEGELVRNPEKDACVSAIAEKLDDLHILHKVEAHGDGEILIRFQHENYKMAYRREANESLDF